jgi:hypothetical protein
MAVPGHASLLQCLVALDGVPPHQQVQLLVQALPGCPLCYMLQQLIRSERQGHVYRLASSSRSSSSTAVGSEEQ